MSTNRLIQFWRQANTARRIQLAICVCVILPLVCILLFGDKPWKGDPTATSLKTSDYVRIWFWVAAAINIFIAGGVALTAPWWSCSATAWPGEFFAKRRPAWFWPVTLPAVLLLVVAAWPRLDQSLWHDEANRVKNALVGSYVEREGETQFRPVKWRDTLFYYKMPNHTLQSILSRASHDVWLWTARPEGFPISERALRVPLLVVGALGLVSMALLLRALGQPLAGVAAAWILAVHPWYIRYASEARGYALVMALIPFLLLALLRGIETGRVRWWVWFALAQVAMVYAYATSAYILIVTNVLFLLALGTCSLRNIDRPRVFARWFIACVAAGGLFLQLFLPCVPQFLDYLQSEKGMGAGNQMNLFWVQNFFAHLFAGIPWTMSQLLDAPYMELLPWAMHHPALMAGVAVVVTGLLALGVRWCLVSGAFTSLAAGVFLFPAIVAFTETKARGSFLFEWYLIFLLPGVVALVALGAVDLARSPSSRVGRGVAIMVLASMGLAYAVGTHPVRKDLAAFSLQPYREAVLATRPSLDPLDPRQDNTITASFHAGPLVYDPLLIKVNSPAELRDLIRRADTDGKDLFLNLAYLDATAHAQPLNHRLVTRSGLFEAAQFFRGFNPTLSTKVFRYRPGSANGFDFRPYVAGNTESPE